MLKKRTVSENIINYLKEEIENIEYGTITIKMRGTDKNIDIASERQRRFETK